MVIPDWSKTDVVTYPDSPWLTTLLTEDSMAKYLMMELQHLVWATALFSMAYKYICHCAIEYDAATFKIPQMQFVKAALATSQEAPEKQLFLAEEHLDLPLLLLTLSRFHKVLPSCSHQIDPEVKVSLLLLLSGSSFFLQKFVQNSIDQGLMNQMIPFRNTQGIQQAPYFVVLPVALFPPLSINSLLATISSPKAPLLNDLTSSYLTNPGLLLFGAQINVISLNSPNQYLARFRKIIPEAIPPTAPGDPLMPHATFFPFFAKSGHPSNAERTGGKSAVFASVIYRAERRIGQDLGDPAKPSSASDIGRKAEAGVLLMSMLWMEDNKNNKDVDPKEVKK
ncbi:hypothetical protein C8J57DRAFT_1253364 [Mycena rebaudengoi]|nr:hypothetical protein C8J57DRAFT_1253364 [Mycena rebaudengoi]